MRTCLGRSWLWVALASTLIVASCASAAFGEGGDGGIPCPTVGEITSKNADVRGQAIGNYLRFRKDLAAALRSILAEGREEGGRDDLRSNACFLIAEMRLCSGDIVDVLVNILEKDFIGPRKDKPYGKMNPPDALVRIGRPAIPKLLEVLSRDGNAQRRYLALASIYAIDGKEVTKFRLANAIKRTEDVKRRAYLEEAAKRVEEW